MSEDIIKKWLIKALNDFKVAEHELERDEREIVSDAVCFHCQQSVEKLLKAYLVSKNVDFGRTHNLEYLLGLCSENSPAFKKLDLGDLTSYAVEVRYPDQFYLPEVSEAKESFQIAKKVKDFVLAKLKIKRAEIY